MRDNLNDDAWRSDMGLIDSLDIARCRHPTDIKQRNLGLLWIGWWWQLPVFCWAWNSDTPGNAKSGNPDWGTKHAETILRYSYSLGLDSLSHNNNGNIGSPSNLTTP